MGLGSPVYGDRERTSASRDEQMGKDGEMMVEQMTVKLQVKLFQGSAILCVRTRKSFGAHPARKQESNIPPTLPQPIET